MVATPYVIWRAQVLYMAVGDILSFSKEPYKRDDILQKRPIILRSLLSTLYGGRSYTE